MIIDCLFVAPTIRNRARNDSLKKKKIGTLLLGASTVDGSYIGMGDLCTEQNKGIAQTEIQAKR